MSGTDRLKGYLSLLPRETVNKKAVQSASRS